MLGADVMVSRFLLFSFQHVTAALVESREDEEKHASSEKPLL